MRRKAVRGNSEPKGAPRRSRRATRGGVSMPPDYQKLITDGVLLPDPNDPHAMKCATCGLPVALVWNHPPGIPAKGRIPAGVWGADVSVICACCSYPHCTHKVPVTKQ